jgi:hypothetical protein
MALSVTTLCIGCHYAECRGLLIIMLSVVILNVIIHSVIMLIAMATIRVLYMESKISNQDDKVF